jgi:hypothetical protein
VTDHDRLFKELLTTFFVEFLELFAPSVLEYLDRDSLVFLDKEVFTDVTAGERHEVDLLVQARFKSEDTVFLIHTENQGQSRSGFGRRLFAYFARLFEKHGKPVYPIVLFTYAEPARAEPAEFLVKFPDKTVLEFRYTVIQLNRLDWRDFLKNENPIASALMAKMRYGPEERPKVKAECLRLLARLRLDPAKAQLISGFVDVYLRLNAEEQTLYDAEVETFPRTEVEAMMQFTTSWEEKGLEKGREEGREDGLRRGLTLAVRLAFGNTAEPLQVRVSRASLPELLALESALQSGASFNELEQLLS